jgi:hypothetical protein
MRFLRHYRPNFGHLPNVSNAGELLAIPAAGDWIHSGYETYLADPEDDPQTPEPVPEAQAAYPATRALTHNSSALT